MINQDKVNDILMDEADIRLQVRARIAQVDKQLSELDLETVKLTLDEIGHELANYLQGKMFNEAITDLKKDTPTTNGAEVRPPMLF
jgi:hypothetical protein